MTAGFQFMLAFVSVAGLLVAMRLLHAIAKRYRWNAEVQRKAVHVATGAFAMSLPWVFSDDWPVYMLLGATLLVMVAIRLPVLSNFGDTLHAVERRSFGDFYLAIAVGLLFLFHNGHAVLYLLPLAVLTLADAAAALAGTTYGRTFFTIEDGSKSVEGSAAFFIVTLITAIVCLMLLTDVAQINTLVLAVTIASFATLVEADSWRGFDNLFLPMGVIIFLTSTLDASVLDVTIRMLMLVGALGAFVALAPKLGLTTHSARVYCVAFFMLLSVVELQNAVLPALMLLAQAVSGRDDGTDDPYPDLDIVGALALISFGFLAAGEATGVNALSFFGLATGLAATGHAALSLRNQMVWIRVAVSVTVAVLIFSVWVWVVGSNPEFSRWHPDLTWYGGSLFASISLLAALSPGAFTQNRGATVALLAAVPTSTIYFILIYAAAQP